MSQRTHAQSLVIRRNINTFWDYDAGTPGTALTNVLTAVDGAGIARKAIDVVVIAVGEHEANGIQAGTITTAEAKSALLSTIDYLRANLGNPLVLLTPLGADKGSSNFTGWGAMRRAQWQLWNENSYILETPSYLDLPHADTLNLNQSGYEAYGGRTARRILGLLGKISTVGTLGPSVASVTFSPTSDNMFVTIAHDAGADFTMTERRGNTVSQNGAANINVPTSIARIDATSFRVTSGLSLTTGDTMTYSWPWGALLGYTQANTLRDNATNTMPLRPSYDVVATEIA